MKHDGKTGWIDKGSNIAGSVGIAVCDGYDGLIDKGTSDICTREFS